VRLAWFASTYARAKIGFIHERRENESHNLKISFLDKFLAHETLRYNELVAFEDSTRLTYGMEPVSPDVRLAGIGGPDRLSGRRSETVFNPIFTRALAVQETLSVLVRKVQLQNATFSEMNEQVERLYTFWEQRPSLAPVAGNITSHFGTRPDPVTGVPAFHEGFDYANEIGTPVFATADGVVKTTGYLQDYGTTIIVSHPETGLESIYAHLSNYNVHPEKRIKRGDYIGNIGNSGKSTGPHLHYEIRKNGHPVNPAKYILPADQIVD